MSVPTYVLQVVPDCPANTAPEAPTGTPVAFPFLNVVLQELEVRIPAGHQGLTGLALVDSGSFVIPYDNTAPAWLVGDNDLLRYNYGNNLGQNVQLVTYNTDDTYDHTWQVRLIYTPAGLAVPASPPLVIPGTLAEVQALLSAGLS